MLLVSTFCLTGPFNWVFVLFCVKPSSASTKTRSWNMNTSVSVWWLNGYMSRVPGQNGVSQAWCIVEINHSGRKPSNYADISPVQCYPPSFPHTLLPSTPTPYLPSSFLAGVLAGEWRRRQSSGSCPVCCVLFVLLCWLLNVPLTSLCTSGTDLLRQLYMLPHWDRSCTSNFLSYPVMVYWQTPGQPVSALTL